MAASGVCAASRESAIPIFERASGAIEHQEALTIRNIESAWQPDQSGSAGLASGEEINWQVLSSGGDIGGASPSFRLSGTVGQTATGSGASGNIRLSHGFWQSFQSGVGYLCGDASGNDAVNISDAVYLINYIFKGGPAPVDDCCP